jgi:GTP-binding protein
VTATICDPSITQAIPTTPIDPPVISMTFLPNTSPLAG